MRHSDEPVKIEDCEVVIVSQVLCDLAYPTLDKQLARRWSEAEIIGAFRPEMNYQHQCSDHPVTVVGLALRDVLANVDAMQH